MIFFVLTGILVGFKASSWAAPLEPLIPKKDLPGDWGLVEGPQTYSPRTLFEHIDGEAELFLKYGFQNSVFAIYQNKKNRENQIELDIYDMGYVLQAFGVFSRFRNEDRPGGFGLDSSLDDHSAFFYQGRYFVLLYAPEPNQEILRQFCKSISLKISDPSPPPGEISYFPKSGLKPGSIQYFSEGLLGHQFLKRGFQGTYVEKVEVKGKVEMKEFHLFLAILKDPQQAMTALKVYKEDLSRKGRVLSGGLIQLEARALKGEDPYQGKVIVLQKGFYLLGVVGFEKEEEGENRLAEFVREVK
jgi:hypothetical protein